MIASDVEQLRRNPLLVPISVDQYHQMIATGILKEGQPIELLEGFLVRKDRSRLGDDPMTVGHDHIWVVYQLGELNEQLKPHNCYIRTQQPISLPPDSEPEPDGAILKGPPDTYRKRKPGPADILAVIEVADSSLEDDRTAKHRIYATAGVPQYIIINLVDRIIEIYTSPDARLGRYASSQSLKSGEMLHLPTGTDKLMDVAVERLLP
jgi:Uma2 family endonuclease